MKPQVLPKHQRKHRKTVTRDVQFTGSRCDTDSWSNRRYRKRPQVTDKSRAAAPHLQRWGFYLLCGKNRYLSEFWLMYHSVLAASFLQIHELYPLNLAEAIFENTNLIVVYLFQPKPVL